MFEGGRHYSCNDSTETRNFLYFCETSVTSSYWLNPLGQTELFEKHAVKKLEAIFTVTLYLSRSRSHVSNMKRAAKLIPYETRVTRPFQQCCVFGNQNCNNVVTWPTLDIWSTHKTTALWTLQAWHVSLQHNDQFPGPFSSAWEATWRWPYAEPSNLIHTTRAHQKFKKNKGVTVCHDREKILLENRWTKNIPWNNTVPVCKRLHGQFVLLKSQTACWIVSESILWGHSVRNRFRENHRCRLSSQWFLKCVSNIGAVLITAATRHANWWNHDTRQCDTRSSGSNAWSIKVLSS